MSITDQLEEERRIINAATAGPWIAEWHGDDWWYSIYGAAAGEEVLPEVATLDDRESKDDATFIAHARTALPLRNAQVAAALRVLDDYAPPSKEDDPTGAVLAHMERLEQAVRTAIQEAQ